MQMSVGSHGINDSIKTVLASRALVWIVTFVHCTADTMVIEQGVLDSGPMTLQDALMKLGER